MNDISTSLFARPSFVEGVARIFDFGNTLNEYNRSATPGDADFESLSTDIVAIGTDFKGAIAQLREEVKASP